MFLLTPCFLSSLPVPPRGGVRGWRESGRVPPCAGGQNGSGTRHWFAQREACAAKAQHGLFCSAFCNHFLSLSCVVCYCSYLSVDCWFCFCCQFCHFGDRLNNMSGLNFVDAPLLCQSLGHHSGTTVNNLHAAPVLRNYVVLLEIPDASGDYLHLAGRSLNSIGPYRSAASPLTLR